MAVSGYFSLGNVFSGASMHQSPSTELIISNTSWFALWHCTLLWFGYVPAMRSLHFVNITGGRPTIRYCLRRLAAGLYGYAVLMLVLEMLGLPIIGGYVHLSRVRNLRTMCIIVGLPTVLIDTQTRILLLGQQNSGFTAASTIGMTNVELHSSNINLVQNFVLWRQKCHTYHTAELQADMYAEYIAISCSASVLFFLGENVHYSRLGLLQKGGIDALHWRSGQFGVLAFQVAIEVLVNYMSVELEMAVGVQFAQIKELSSFFGAVFATIAFLNIVVVTVMVNLD
ncbi:hypothetical protein JG688_00010622 [Phytophthora aleatoria]|uniref:Transmembrane protein n=1 Tax=Phytophthora aleatoria TaxID=2496075 RepID=A0A8J5M376_9STRA|nr:hypothetical protein JG688_00010622 [Phytophthora aleatoria]